MSASSHSHRLGLLFSCVSSKSLLLRCWQPFPDVRQCAGVGGQSVSYQIPRERWRHCPWPEQSPQRAQRAVGAHRAECHEPRSHEPPRSGDRLSNASIRVSQMASSRHASETRSGFFPERQGKWSPACKRNLSVMANWGPARSSGAL